MLHIPIVHAHDVIKQIPWGKNFRIKQLVHASAVRSSRYEVWEVLVALKKLELLEATPRATLTYLSSSPNFPRASYLDERTLTYEPIVNYNPNLHWTPRFARAS